MQSQLTRAWVEIDLGALLRNGARVAEHTGSRLLPMVKADAYGLGARSSALAGAGASDASGWEATWSNPAGLADAERRRFSLGWVLGSSALQLQGVSLRLERIGSSEDPASLHLELGLYLPGADGRTSEYVCTDAGNIQQLGEPGRGLA